MSDKDLTCDECQNISTHTIGDLDKELLRWGSVGDLALIPTVGVDAPCKIGAEPCKIGAEPCIVGAEPCIVE